MARVGLFEHRKFKRLSATLGGRAIALGSLELLWHGCYQNADDYLGDEVDVEAAADWRGEPGKLATALLAAGFIEADPDRSGYRVHDLFDHAPAHVREKLERELARRQAGESLSEARRRAGKAGRAAQLSRANTAAGAQQAPDTCQAPTGQNSHVGRGEARRGEASKSNVDPGVDDSAKEPLATVTPLPRFDFDALYDRYPRKEGKAAGMKSARSRFKTQAAYDRFAAAVDNYAAKVQREGTERQHTLLWSTFTNGRWEDYAPGAPALMDAPVAVLRAPPLDECEDHPAIVALNRRMQLLQGDDHGSA